jgi:hypothetical protein
MKSRFVLLCAIAVVSALPRISGAFQFLGFGRAEPGSDPAIQQILAEIRVRQPAPYGLPDDSTYNYIWAQNAMAFLAAERCGYMSRNEAIARLKGMLNIIEPLERHHGFSFDGYDVKTAKKTTDKIYFQGWWFSALAVLKNAYPELAPQCEKMLAEVDYAGSGLFNPDTRQLAGDYWPEEKRVSYWIDLYWGPTGEFRTPYVMYSYLTGDISPWTRWCTPRLIDLEGHPILGVWHSFIFCTMLVHSEFLDVGYLERSWNEMLKGLDVYRRKNGMTFYPTRAEPLEAWSSTPTNEWPNTEHRIAKPWLAWFRNRNAPVMEKAFTPGYGVSLYCDNMNFFWSYGTQTVACADEVGGAYRLPFDVTPLPDRYTVRHPLELTSVTLLASCRSGDQAPAGPMEIRLNGAVIATVSPRELSETPRQIRRTLKGALLVRGTNELVISTSDSRPGCGYTLYHHEHDFWRASYAGRDVTPPYAEITIDGQCDGGENAYAALARCAAVHGYYVWQEMLNDPKFLDATVAWVGDYYNRVRLARVVHNISDTPVTVEYKRPADWKDADTIQVTDITEGSTPKRISISVGRRNIRWQAAPRRTYRIASGRSTAM